MTRFGDFAPLCNSVPSYPWCNLFYRQLLDLSPSTLTGNSSNPLIAPVGVNIECGIPRLGNISDGAGSLPNIANIIACALSIIFTLALIALTERRKAAVGRIELRTFLVLYLITLPLQLVDTGSFLQQGSTGLVAVTAIHAASVTALFWVLLANALVATQMVEDGTMASLVPVYGITLLIFGGTVYVSLDTALHVTDALGRSDPPEDLHSIALFVLTSIWPGVCAIGYFSVMTWIVLAILNETRPMWYYLLSFVLFALSQLAWFLLGKVVCKGTGAKIDGSFIATLLESASVGVLWLAWRSITEESWDEDAYYPS